MLVALPRDSTPVDDDELTLALLRKVGRDLRAAAQVLTASEARFLVDLYYQRQEERKTAASQQRTARVGGEPNAFVTWLAEADARIETNIKAALAVYTEQSVLGRWLRSITGIGPVISAGLLAHIDVTREPTVGHLWRFAGLDPTLTWERGQKRPYNAKLKTLAVYKAGESFVKFQNHPHDHYGQLFVARKRYEWERNAAGACADQARQALARARYAKDTAVYKWYSGQFRLTERFQFQADAQLITEQFTVVPEGQGTPMLPPAQCHARARRWVVKLFLSHVHMVAYWLHYGVLPARPYVLEYGESAQISIVLPARRRAHFLAPPNLELVPGLREALEAWGPHREPGKYYTGGDV